MQFLRGKRLALLVFGASLLILVGPTTVYFLKNNLEPIDVQDLWDMKSDGVQLEDKTVLVRGASIFNPNSEFRFNGFYLVDHGAMETYQTPEYALWFGIRIEGLNCQVKENENSWICEPFSPSHGSIFEFKGTVHLKQIGKKEVMWLSEVDFETSRQLVNGTWQSIRLGDVEVIVEK